MVKTYVSAVALAAALLASPAQSQTMTPAPAQPAATSAAPVSADQFVDKAANSGMFEIQSSQAAQSKSQDARIKDFAQKMITDHTQASEKLKAAAGSRTVPASLDQEHASKLQQLQQASGANFDKSYVQMQLEGHQQAVSLFDAYSRSGDDPALKQFATETLPTLRMHLQMVTQLHDQAATPDRTASNASAGPGFMTDLKPGVWRASKLSGVDVYNSSNEKIGDVSDVILDTNGNAKAVVIGVGGFLGVGERNVAVPFSALQWNAADNSTSSGGMSSSSTSSSDSVPARAVLPNVSKDQLTSAPQFGGKS